MEFNKNDFPNNDKHPLSHEPMSVYESSKKNNQTLNKVFKGFGDAYKNTI